MFPDVVKDVVALKGVVGKLVRLFVARVFGAFERVGELSCLNLKIMIVPIHLQLKFQGEFAVLGLLVFVRMPFILNINVTSLQNKD